MNARVGFVVHFPAVLEGVEGQKIFSEVQKYLSEVYPANIVFDLFCVQELTIETIDCLLLCLSEIAECDGEVKLAGASPKIQVVLELTQIINIVEHYSSVQDALDSWNTMVKVDVRQPENSAAQI